MDYESIYITWKELCEERENDILNAWSKGASIFTSVMKDNEFPPSIIRGFATKLQLKILFEYYSTDVVLYRTDSLLVGSSPNQVWTNPDGNWLKTIDIAIEHENQIEGNKGGYQEICHLLTTNAKFKILIGYPERFSENDIASDFQSLLAKCSENSEILFISGQKINNKITWNGFLLTNKSYKQLEI